MNVNPHLNGISLPEPASNQVYWFLTASQNNMENALIASRDLSQILTETASLRTVMLWIQRDLGNAFDARMRMLSSSYLCSLTTRDSVLLKLLAPLLKETTILTNQFACLLQLNAHLMNLWTETTFINAPSAPMQLNIVKTADMTATITSFAPSVLLATKFLLLKLLALFVAPLSSKH